MARIEKTVFISYRRADFALAQLIHDHFDDFDVFIDYLGIASGDFASTILENIRTRPHFVVILTRATAYRWRDESDWQRREVEAAIVCRRNIVPIFVDGFSFSDPAIAAYLTGGLATLSRYNGVTLLPEYFKAAMERLRRFLGVPL
jgi:hypothetical protein